MRGQILTPEYDDQVILIGPLCLQSRYLVCNQRSFSCISAGTWIDWMVLANREVMGAQDSARTGHSISKIDVSSHESRLS